MMGQIRSAMLAPTARKAPPVFNLSQLAAMLGAEKGSVSHRMSRGDLPSGKLNSAGSRREFTLAEARTWVREYRKDRLRPAAAEAVTISVGNFKGGVGKTTTAMTLAQGLSLLGHRVLVIDTDPQGSLTTLFGILPDTEVDERQTILPLASTWWRRRRCCSAPSSRCPRARRKSPASSSGTCCTTASTMCAATMT